MRLREVVKIVMERDGVSQDEAVRMAKDAYESAMEALYEGGDPEEVWMEEIGLEPDYLI